MFEKEAEENKPPYAFCALDTKCELWKDGFQKGAEFAYNKAKEEMQAQIEKMKCCENCKHSDTECEGHTICNKGHFFDCLSNKIFDHTSEDKDYWEIKE